jgi:hypothetical protein
MSGDMASGQEARLSGGGNHDRDARDKLMIAKASSTLALIALACKS